MLGLYYKDYLGCNINNGYQFGNLDLSACQICISSSVHFYAVGCISKWKSMKSSNSWPILSYVGWTNMCYAYCVTPHFVNSADLIWFLLSNVWSLHIPLILGARKMYLMDVFHNYRWLVIPVDRLKASAVKLAVDLSSHRPHRRIWPS